MTEQHSILPLSVEVQKQIKSSVSVNSLNQVILELVKNSLDAGARTLQIYVDPARGACTVEDDGHGIPAVEFGADGHLGKIYCTSKHINHQKTYGSSGCFISALSALSLLSITSRQMGSSDECKVIFHRSQAIDHSHTCETQQRTIIATQGTKVEVWDLFGMMPVRVKCRVATFGNQSNTDNEFDHLKRCLVALLVACARPMKAIIAGEDRKRRYVLNIRPGSDVSSVSAARLSPTARRPIHSDWICPLLCQAGLIDHLSAKYWAIASAETSAISICAVISLEPAPTKQVQFISFGMRPLGLRDGRLLYNEVNSMFAMSTFGVVKDSEEISEAEKLGRKNDRRFKPGELAMRQLRGITKGADRWPMFCIRIDTTADEGIGSVVNSHGETGESTKHLQKVLDLLRAFICRFLEEHQFRPKARTRRKHDRNHDLSFPSTSDSAEKSAFVDDALPRPVSRAFEAWSRVKSAYHVREDEMLYGLPRSKHHLSISRSFSAPPSIQPASHKVDIGRSTLAELYSPVELGRHTQLLLGELEHDTLSSDDSQATRIDHDTHPATELEEPIIKNDGLSSRSKSPYFGNRPLPWHNVRTSEHMYNNSRTGLVVTRQNGNLRISPGPLNLNPKVISLLPPTDPGGLLPERTKITEANSKLQLNQDSWLSRMMSDSSLEAFHQDEKPIPSIVIENQGLGLNSSCRGHNDVYGSRVANLNLYDPNNRSLHRLSRSVLVNAQVIAQVDQKYILAKLPTLTSSAQAEGDATLILIDQHAADERCRVEALYEEACQLDNSTLLPKAICFEVSSREAGLFEREKIYFAVWGFDYETCWLAVDEDRGSARQSQLVVTALPRLIAERCRVSPKLLVDMLRKEIWIRADEENSSQLQHHRADSTKSSPTDDNAAPSWLSRISLIPRGLLEMLNSRACRSAVMFNDVLSLAECETLIRRLAGCRFPFICAHGRTSVVVLGGIGEVEVSGEEETEAEGEGKTGQGGFAEGWGWWMTKQAKEGNA